MMYKDQNLYFYTFSTIVQGFLALVAFLGTVVIYKLQIIEQELNNVRDRMIDDLIVFLGSAANSYSWIKAKNEVELILKSRKTQPAILENEISRLEYGYNKLENESKTKGEIRTLMVDFSTFSFINIGISLLGIPFSKMFLENSWFLAAEILLIVSVFWSIYTLILAMRVIRLALGYNFSLIVGSTSFKVKSGIGNITLSQTK
jgi:hypothetical protein